MNIKQNQTSTLQNISCSYSHTIVRTYVANTMAEKVDGRIIEPGPKAEGDTKPNPSHWHQVTMSDHVFWQSQKCVTYHSRSCCDFPFNRFLKFFVFTVVLLCRFVQISTPKATTDGWKSVATSACGPVGALWLFWCLWSWTMGSCVAWQSRTLIPRFYNKYIQIHSFADQGSLPKNDHGKLLVHTCSEFGAM